MSIEVIPLQSQPLMVIVDRYNGTYSGGYWLAVANADEPQGSYASRADWLFDANGPCGGEEEAVEFWTAPPSWIAAGRTPELAVSGLTQSLQANVR